MWANDSLWFEVAIISIGFTLGHIAFGLFEERTPRWRKLLKYVLTLIIGLTISIYVGRSAMFTFFGIMSLAVIYIHFVLLPKKGINGWTGEPKKKYYEFRGWDQNIFKD